MQNLLNLVFLSLIALVQGQAEASAQFVPVQNALSAVHEPYSKRVFVAAGSEGIAVLNAENGASIHTARATSGIQRQR